MKIPYSAGDIRRSELFRMIWKGWFLGVFVIFIPLFSVIAISALLGGDADIETTLFSTNVENSIVGIIMMPFLVALIAAIQGIFVGLLVALGLSASQWWGQLRGKLSSKRSKKLN